MNERRHTDDVRSRRGPGFEGGRDMSQDRARRGAQWRDQGEGEFAASRRDEWDRDSGYDGPSGDRYEREQWDGSDRERFGDFGQDRRPGYRQSMGGGYGTSNEGVGQRESRFAGMGPKGYRRSDERIREDLCDRLTDDGGIDGSEIEVQVQGGEVTLSGTVADRAQKRRAEDIAESCSGVGNVTNNIRTEGRTNGRTDPGVRRT
jgi:hypothetical protein